MRPIRIVVHPSLARASILALAAMAGLIMSAVVVREDCLDVHTQAQHSDKSLRPLSTCVEQGYCSYEHKRPGGLDLQAGEVSAEANP